MNIDNLEAIFITQQYRQKIRVHLIENVFYNIFDEGGNYERMNVFQDISDYLTNNMGNNIYRNIQKGLNGDLIMESIEGR